MKIFLIISFLFFSIQENVALDTELMGNWKITDYKFAGISGLSEEEAKDYVGKSLKIDSSFMSILSQDDYLFYECNKPIYHIREVNASEYLSFNYRINPQNLDINSKNIEILEVYCSESVDLENDYPEYDFIYYEGCLIGNFDGVFFKFEQEGS